MWMLHSENINLVFMNIQLYDVILRWKRCKIKIKRRKWYLLILLLLGI